MLIGAAEFRCKERNFGGRVTKAFLDGITGSLTHNLRAGLKELGNPLWRFENAILQFNNNCYLMVQSFAWLVVDESMSA